MDSLCQRMSVAEKLLKKVAAMKESEQRNKKRKITAEELMNLDMMRPKLSREEKLAEKERKVDQVLTTLNERIRAVEERENDFNSFVEAKTREIELKEEELRLKLEEFDKNTSEFNSFREKKMEELNESDKEMTRRRRSLNQLSKKLESSKKEVDKRFKEVKSREGSVVRKKHRLTDNKKQLASMERSLKAWREELKDKEKEIDFDNRRWWEKLDSREKYMRECFKKYEAKMEILKLEKILVVKVARFVGIEEENLKDAIWALQHSDGYRAWEESPDLKFTVRMDGKNLQMFLNDPAKDLVSTGDEIFQVLHLSSDPAKLVLDAMAGFYPPHLREGDTELHVRKTCIALLKQLMKMSMKIKPCVREEAVQIALAWKSRMSPVAENPSSLEVLGFLLLLGAYGLASSFDKHEISTLLKMVPIHREEIPDLEHRLGIIEAQMS